MNFTKQLIGKSENNMSITTSFMLSSSENLNFVNSNLTLLILTGNNFRFGSKLHMNRNMREKKNTQDMSILLIRILFIF